MMALEPLFFVLCIVGMILAVHALKTLLCALSPPFKRFMEKLDRVPEDKPKMDRPFEEINNEHSDSGVKLQKEREIPPSPNLDSVVTNLVTTEGKISHIEFDKLTSTMSSVI